MIKEENNQVSTLSYSNPISIKHVSPLPTVPSEATPLS